ncbi:MULTISPECIES: YdeI family protein [Microbacterium]|uniref:YdeI/OmpD-associated family protein n=1 Tax=Microbacterium profundi TaxID=450380 RepID=A0ABV3LFV3_9MICO|nr:MULTISPECIES: YdeI/OmpD-associated family protein [Microbacterium]MCE7482916.1 YdeI/OmpD-associated family protein [Microbacterium profundi]
MDDEAGQSGGSAEKPAVYFRDAAEFRTWLERHHASESELWMEVRKAHVADRGLTWADAVPEALCFGWIDSVSQPIDDDRRRQRWTPRKAGSTWSKVNVGHVERLVAEGRMASAGLGAFEARSAERTGTYSHENDDAELEPEVQAVLESSAAAQAFLDAAAAGYRKAVRHWIATAKRPATRIARAEQLVAESAAGRLVPFARPGKTPAWLVRAAAAAAAVEG